MVDSPTLKAASGSGRFNGSSTRTESSISASAIWRASARPARPPPQMIRSYSGTVLPAGARTIGMSSFRAGLRETVGQLTNGWERVDIEELDVERHLAANPRRQLHDPEGIAAQLEEVVVERHVAA